MTLPESSAGPLFPVGKGRLLLPAIVAIAIAVAAIRFAETRATNGHESTTGSRTTVSGFTPVPTQQAESGRDEGSAGGGGGTAIASTTIATGPSAGVGSAAVRADGASPSQATPAPATAPAPGGATIARSGTAPSVIVADSRAFVKKLYRNFFGLEGDPLAVELWASLIDAGTITPEQAVESFLDSAHQYRGTAPVARLYLATFLRAPDFDGLAHWRDAILAGETLDEIGERFASSPEFTDRYGALDDAGFIDLAFQNALGREPTEAERMQWRQRLGPGAEARGRMMVALSESEEFRESVRGEVDAVLLYAGLLGRAADRAGFAGWIGFLQEGNSRQALIRGFLTSSEFRGRLVAAGTGTGG